MKILVGIDGTERGERALEWAARYGAREGAALTLIAVVDPAAARAYGIDKQTGDAAIEGVLQEAKDKVLAKYPDTEVDTAISVGKVVDCLVDAAESHDMVVMGSHHGASVGETVGGAKGLRVSVSVDVPTVVIPCDWEQDSSNHRIVVGVGPDESSLNAIRFAVREAVTDGEQLDLVSGWGLPAILTKPAEAMGGGLDPVGEQYQRNLEQLAAVNGAVSCHIIASGMFNGLFEIVVHDMPREQAHQYISQFRTFYTAGWLQLMGQ